MPGNLRTMAGDITGVDAGRDAGTLFRIAGAIGSTEFPPSQASDNKVRKWVGTFFETLPQFGTQVAGSMVGGIWAFVALGVAPVMGDQYVETKERRLREGATEEEAKRDALIESAIAA